MDITYTFNGADVIGLSVVPNPGDQHGTIDSSQLTHGFDADLYKMVNGAIQPMTNDEVQAVLAKRKADEEAMLLETAGNDVILQHMIQEKKTELTWSSTKQYHIGDVVYYDGRMWASTSNNINNPPDDVVGDWTETD